MVPETLEHQIQAPAGAVTRFRRLNTAAPLPTLKLYLPLATQVPPHSWVASRICGEALTAQAP